jgi:hypothetical protein
MSQDKTEVKSCVSGVVAGWLDLAKECFDPRYLVIPLEGAPLIEGKNVGADGDVVLFFFDGEPGGKFTG